MTTNSVSISKIAQEELYGKVKTIALVPVNVPAGIVNPKVQVKFEALIGAKLREAGFSIVPSQEAVDIWKRMPAQGGGYFNPVTGQPDKAKLQAGWAHVLRELSTQCKADAILRSNIQVVQANFAGNEASWHGTSELLTSGGSIEKLFER